ncbi:(-)-germacrene D synthase-like [Punica granatum]|uniref:(-)-germacrene D synthase-like n=1 Tax=Punica granatum TaxID=22663 RepID=A0A6P8C547_PUNGR|nr:(-)-germacrene D synthase-like [Punica granatum]
MDAYVASSGQMTPINVALAQEQRCIGYHFEKEIDEALKQVHERSIESVDGPSFASDLYTTALMFRLLRQQGYKINSSAFSKFKGPDGNFDESLETDVRGLLSLYEASHLRTHGEDVLEEALAFTLTHLASTNEKLGPALIRDEISRSQRQFNIRKGWDMEVIDELPDYMQVCYRALLDVYREAEHLLPEEVGSYRISFGIESMKGMVRAHFAEAKWFHRQYTPSMEEYMQVALVSAGGLLLSATAFVGLKDAFEQKVGQAVSAVECYMKQYGVTEEEAKHELWKHVIDAWKDINEEALHQTVVSAPLLHMIIDIARMMGVWYEDIDIYKHSRTKMKVGIASLFIDPFPLDM